MKEKLSTQNSKSTKIYFKMNVLCIRNYYKLSSFKKHTFTISQWIRNERMAQLGPCKAAITVSARAQSSSRSLTNNNESSSKLTSVGGEIHFLESGRWGHPQQLDSACNFLALTACLLRAKKWTRNSRVSQQDKSLLHWNIIMGVVAHHFCYILLVRSNSQVPPTLKLGGSISTWTPEDGESLGVTSGSVRRNEGEIKNIFKWKKS